MPIKTHANVEANQQSDMSKSPNSAESVNSQGDLPIRFTTQLLLKSFLGISLWFAIISRLRLPPAEFLFGGLVGAAVIIAGTIGNHATRSMIRGAGKIASWVVVIFSMLLALFTLIQMAI